MVQAANLGSQFRGYAGGPEEVSLTHFRQRHGLGTPEEEDPEGEHPRLFHPESVPLPESHHQTPEQFARDPRTWWHGRVTKGGPQGRLGGSGIGRGEGFHAGSVGAARQRVTTNVGKGLKEGMAGRLYPLRITGPVEGPENIQPDVRHHYMLGPAKYRYGQTVGGRTTGYLYHNVAEGGSNEISVGVPQRKGFMSTQREMVSEAKKQGKFVHPNIEWAVKNLPEHTSEKITPRYHQETPEGHRYNQPMLQQGLEDVHKGAEIARQMYPETSPIERRSYQTSAGGTQHVWRYRDQLAQRSLFGRQWSMGNYEHPRPSRYENGMPVYD